MDFFKNLNLIISLLIGFGIVIGGGVGVFFIIRSQLTRVLAEEVEAYRGQVDRLKKDLDELKLFIDRVKIENSSLIAERDYLRSLILSALTTKETINSGILEEALRRIDVKQIILEKKEVKK